MGGALMASSTSMAYTFSRASTTWSLRMKPVYVKEQRGTEPSVLIYFWDSCDRDQFSGWFVAPAIGGTFACAHHGDASSLYPPASDWQTPPNGAVVNGLTVMPFFGSQGRNQTVKVAPAAVWVAPSAHKNVHAEPSAQLDTACSARRARRRENLADEPFWRKRSRSRWLSSDKATQLKKKRVSGVRKVF